LLRLQKLLVSRRRCLPKGEGKGNKARSDVAAVLSFVKQLAADGPVKKGAKADGKAFALWKKTIAGKDASLLLLRVEPGRFRYLVALTNADGTRTPLLTGVFVKKGPGTGGGRFHVNLTNVSDAFNAPNADGSIHFWFANHKGDKRGRRIAYKDVVRRDDPRQARHQLRSGPCAVTGRWWPIPFGGAWAISLRHPDRKRLGCASCGKRAKAVAEQQPCASIANKQLIGTAHECWG
jgi:hypothetical protein